MCVCVDDDFLDYKMYKMAVGVVDIYGCTSIYKKKYVIYIYSKKTKTKYVHCISLTFEAN